MHAGEGCAGQAWSTGQELADNPHTHGMLMLEVIHKLGSVSILVPRIWDLTRAKLWHAGKAYVKSTTKCGGYIKKGITVVLLQERRGQNVLCE